MASFNFFGRKRDAPQDGEQEPLGKLDLPPPPIPDEPAGMDTPSFAQSFTDNSRIQAPALDDSKPAAGAEQASGLDKDWTDFMKTNEEAVPEKPEEDWNRFVNSGGAGEEKRMEIPEEPVKRSMAAQEKVTRPDAMKEVAKGPVFIEMDTYGGFLGEVGTLSLELHMLDEMVAKMEGLREKEEYELRRWHQGFDDVRRKLLYMDDALFALRR